MRTSGWGAAAVTVLLCVGCASGGSEAGKGAAVACVQAVDAMREMANGTRSVQSTVEALEAAEPRARRAARANAKYRPIAEWIVGAQDEITAGQPAGNTRNLIEECG